jgi:hypothetical protein
MVYFSTVVSIWFESGQLASPAIPLLVTYTLVICVLAVIGHIVAATLTPKDARTAVDERERQIFSRAGHYGSVVSGAGVVMSLGGYLLSQSGDLLFHTVLASLMLGQVADYVLQIRYYRTSI